MRPEIIAITSSMLWAADAVLVSLGARTSNVLAAAFMSYAFSAVSMWIILFTYFSFDRLASRATIFFLLSGCLQPLLARIFYYTGITRIGVARAGPLRGAEPLLSVTIAILFLHERPSINVYAGAALIVASVWLVLWRSEGEAHATFVDYMLPLAAALCGAVSQNLRKSGLLILHDPYAGTAVSTSVSLALFAAYLAGSGKGRRIVPTKQSLPFFIAAAMLSTGAQVMNYAALNMGEVSAMVPLLNTTPLFAVLFSAIFLRHIETVTLRVAFGALVMFAGVLIIALR
ncbi:MAG TPA: DMT family transporter [Verrucomicrobiae bacterium]|jgi:drug/metabolite transporter, DME family|nr:DMT family transporter [Verrucomicrobiae bacterium]